MVLSLIFVILIRQKLQVANSDSCILGLDSTEPACNKARDTMMWNKTENYPYFPWQYAVTYIFGLTWWNKQSGPVNTCSSTIQLKIGAPVTSTASAIGMTSWWVTIWRYIIRWTLLSRSEYNIARLEFFEQYLRIAVIWSLPLRHGIIKMVCI